MNDIWTALPGFFDFDHLYTDWANRFNTGDVIVEVGSFYGRSACYLGELIRKSGKQITLICVDVWNCKFLANEEEGIYESFLAGIRIGGLKDIIVPIRGPSTRIAGLVRNDLAAVFSDGDHSYEAVKADIDAWLPKVRRGGVLAGHDYSDPAWAGVTQAVSENLPGQVRQQGRCWIHDVL